MIIRKYSLACLIIAFFLTAGLLTPVEAASGKKKSSSTRRTGRAQISAAYADPYLGAIVVDVSTGKVIFEDNPDKQGYPASMVKLMDLLIVLEKIEKGALKLDDKITVSAEVSRIGGSGVYLKQGETFSVNELIYAMIIQSANDAAAALAYHIAGTKEGFVQLMNAKAAELGMKSTKFSSVHGLPPAEGQEPDITTARDMSILCLELLKHPQTLQYTATTSRIFRIDPLFKMETHNKLLKNLAGCDGLKTGYYRLAGFSISATAMRNNRRIVAVLLGSEHSKVRDEKAVELMTSAFMNLPPLIPEKPAVTNTVQEVKAPSKESKDKKSDDNPPPKSRKTRIAIYAGLSVIGIAVAIRLFRLSSIMRY